MGNLTLHLRLQVNVVVRNRCDPAHPETHLLLRDDDRIALVVGAEDELGEEFDFTTVFAFRFDFVIARRRKILDLLRILDFIQQQLIDQYQQPIRPVGVELRTKIVVGIERGILAEDHLQKAQKSRLARIAFARYQQQNRQHLCRAQIKQLQVIHSQFDLLAEDMREKCPDIGKFALGGPVRKRLVKVQMRSVYLSVVHMVGNYVKPVVLFDFGKVVLTVVLPQRFITPRYTFLDGIATDKRTLHDLNQGRGHAHIFLLLLHRLIGF